jgi:hypothetical protein
MSDMEKEVLLESFPGENGPCGETLKQYMVPVKYHAGILRYVVLGIRTGSFLSSVIANDLRETIFRADDDIVIADISAILKWFYNEAPSPCHGSVQDRESWIKNKIQTRKEIAALNEEKDHE